jgi:hypothetical protein
MALRWVGLGILLFALALGAVTYRYLQIWPYPMGGGRYEDSPNGLFTASASNLYDENFWGNSRNYYEFEVQDTNGTVLRSVQIPQPPNPVGFRGGNGRIMWAADSKSVSFGTLTMTIWTTPVP